VAYQVGGPWIPRLSLPNPFTSEPKMSFCGQFGLRMATGAAIPSQIGATGINRFGPCAERESYTGFWVMRRSGGAVRGHLDDLDAVSESDTSATDLSHSAAHSTDRASACSNTIRVAFSCLSGGYPYLRKMRFTSTRSCARTFSRNVVRGGAIVGHGAAAKRGRAWRSKTRPLSRLNLFEVCSPPRSSWPARRCE